jgi:hypothetical protein
MRAIRGREVQDIPLYFAFVNQGGHFVSGFMLLITIWHSSSITESVKNNFSSSIAEAKDMMSFWICSDISLFVFIVWCG